ncbi:MAG: hypothetical protein AABW47_04110 [Nanoarchaeota archaeon]
MKKQKILNVSKKIAISFFLLSLILIIGSYILYHFVIVGQTECGSPCSSWLSPILSTQLCIQMCVVQDIPHPFYSSLLKVGALLLAISIILFLLSYFKFKKHY